MRHSHACCLCVSPPAFWQAPDDELRGYPKNASESADLILVSLSPGGHVALHGSGMDGVQEPVSPSTTASTRAFVVRLKLSRATHLRKLAMAGVEILETFCAQHEGLLTSPFSTDFAINKTVLLAMEKGKSLFFDEALNGLDLRPFLDCKSALRSAAILLPRLVDAALAAIEKDAEIGAEAATVGKDDAEMPDAPPPPPPPPNDANRRVTLGGQDDRRRPPLQQLESPSPASTDAPVASVAPVASAADVEGAELILLDLLHAPPDTYLYSLATTISRLDHLSHVLCWAKWCPDADSVNLVMHLRSARKHMVPFPRLSPRPRLCA